MITDLDLDASPSVALPPAVEQSSPGSQDRHVSILGVRISDVTRPRAIELIESLIRQPGRTPHSIYFANAHTLNLACSDPSYRAVLNGADHVFGDGTGVRWAARLQGIRVRDNVNGTDLLPEFFQATADRGYRYFLLGADDTTIRDAARQAADRFAGWTQVGFHHGYLGDAPSRDRVIRRIGRAKPDVLLVGMGNPRQEFWIHEHRERLGVPVCIGVGGLFDFWSGHVSRAPSRLRGLGHEWLWRLWQQPDKARRDLLGNPLFLARILRATLNRGQGHY